MKYDCIVYGGKYRHGFCRKPLGRAIIGLNNIGVETIFSKLSNKSNRSNIMLTWNKPKAALGRGWKRKRKIFKRHKTPYTKIIMEMGFFNRNKYCSVGWNDTCFRADFMNKDMPDDRWQKLNMSPKNWRKNGSHILICGQVKDDATIQHLSYSRWLGDTVNEIRKHSDRRIVFRNHPKNRKKIKIPEGVEIISGKKRPLYYDLHNAWAMVAYNSTALCEAIYNGIPVFMGDDRKKDGSGAMTYDIGLCDLSKIENPLIMDRTQWFNDIAYAQWNHSEIASGEPFDHLLVKKHLLKAKTR